MTEPSRWAPDAGPGPKHRALSAAPAPDDNALTKVDASSEPSVMFASLARQSILTFSDRCTIEIIEPGRDICRISETSEARRRPASARSATSCTEPDRAHRQTHSHGHELRTTFRSAGGRANDRFSGEVVHSWFEHGPTAADASIARLAVDLTVMTVERERLILHVQRVAVDAGVPDAVSASNRHIGTALGILMAAYKISDSGALELLRAVSRRAHLHVRDLAMDVVRAGWPTNAEFPDFRGRYTYEPRAGEKLWPPLRDRQSPG